MSNLLPIGVAAARVGITRDSMRRRIERGLVKGARSEYGRWWVPADEVERMQADNKVGGTT
jgi:predicted site-specific integrase-resolvase